MSGKQESATSERDPNVAENKQTMSHCVNCGQGQGDKCKFKRCSGCETVKYIFVIAEWATLLVDIRCPRGGS